MSDQHRDLKARVLHYLLEHRGKTVFLDKMATELKEPARRIQQCISHINRQEQHRVELLVTVKGHAWFVTPEKTQDNRVKYAQIMELKRSGSILLEREDGRVFQAVLTEVE